MTAYYNDHDPKVCAWLRALIADGHLPEGDVDERSILDVRPVDLAGFTACHFFAGIGGWPLALRLAGWPDDRPVWTGSPPCQPFSAAGQRRARDDDRHLAPAFLGLVRACRPPMLFGEQVASATVLGKARGLARGAASSPPEWAWLDDLSDGLEAAGYAVGAADLPAAGVGAPHIRQRVFFGAVRIGSAWPTLPAGIARTWPTPRRVEDAEHAERRAVGEHRQDGCDGPHGGRQEAHGLAGARGKIRRLGDADDERHRGRGEGIGAEGLDERSCDGRACARPGPPDAFWRDADWLYCRDGKWRPVKSSVQRVADGVSRGLVPSGDFVSASFPLVEKAEARTMRLRGYGNAIVPAVASQFIQAFMEACYAGD